MDKLKIVTNGHARKLYCLVDLPKTAQADFDYIQDGEKFLPRLVQYCEAWHDLNTFVRIVPRQCANAFQQGVDNGSPLLHWNGIHTETFFSGVLFRWDGDGENVIMGVCYCTD